MHCGSHDWNRNSALFLEVMTFKWIRTIDMHVHKVTTFHMALYLCVFANEQQHLTGLYTHSHGVLITNCEGYRLKCNKTGFAQILCAFQVLKVG